ncbi:DmpA/ArgJ-like protein [Trichoderma compactum]
MTQKFSPLVSPPLPAATRPRIRELGYSPGKFAPGPKNSILDVPGVQVGQVTVNQGTDIHTGLTLVSPRGIKETRLTPCYAATHDLNGMGELTGTHALAEYGYINTPITITNTVSVDKVYDGLFLWQMEQARKDGEDDIESLRRFCIPVVGETYDGLLNDISASVLDKDSVYAAIEVAQSQTEGGTGTSSRIVPGADLDYTVGVLVQANHGQKPDLRIGNVPIGELLVAEEAKAKEKVAEASSQLPTGGKAAEGSNLTDAALLPHQLRRLAQHAGMGITHVGGHSAGRKLSGEIFLALSTGTSPNQLATASDGLGYLPPLESQSVDTLKDETIDTLSYVVSETTEEAILNAMCKAETMVGFKGRTTKALPVDRVKELLKQYGVGLSK